METPRRLKRPWATWALALSFVLVYLADAAMGGKLFVWGKRDVHYFFLKPEPHRFVASLFLHGFWWHLISNTLATLMIGALIEELVGWWMVFYTFSASGVVGNLAASLWGPSAAGVGASGGIAGLFGLLFVCSLRKLYPASREMLLMMVVMLLLGVGMAFGPLPVDNYAHLGGLLAGAVLGLFARRGGMHPAGLAVTFLAIAFLWWKLTASPLTSPG